MHIEDRRDIAGGDAEVTHLADYRVRGGFRASGKRANRPGVAKIRMVKVRILCKKKIANLADEAFVKCFVINIYPRYRVISIHAVAEVADRANK